MSNPYATAIHDYVDLVARRYASGISTEHSYRGDLQKTLEMLCADVTVTNEPKRQACGAPDYIITKKNIPIGHIEAKDVGKDLDDKSLPGSNSTATGRLSKPKYSLWNHAGYYRNNDS